MTMLKRSWSAASINSLKPEERADLLKDMTNEDARRYLNGGWLRFARDEQLPPSGDWRIWLFLGGRGAGKTRAGAEWIAHGVANGVMRHIGLAGATFFDVRAVMIEGESGLKAVSPGADFEPSNRRVLWPNGAVASVISAEEPDYVRGHQFDAVWADEFCKWSAPQESLDMILMALRLGQDPRMLITTTPRAIAALKDLIAMPDVAETRSNTAANAANLSPSFLAGLELRFAGTRLGRQELEAEIIEDNEDAPWRRAWIDKARRKEYPKYRKMVVAVDPPASVAGDECGIVIAGLGEDGDGYVVADWSVAGKTAAGWAAQVAEAYLHFEADCIIAEANQGGDMVKQVLIDALPNAPVRLVHATRNKRTRAAPAAALYEQGRVHHCGTFAELEDQMCQYDGKGKSPDRMDALVWAITHLFPAERSNPRARVL